MIIYPYIFQPPWGDRMGWLFMAFLIGSSRSVHQDLLNTFPSMRRAQMALKHDELRPKLSLAAANGFEPIHHFVILTSCMEEILKITKWWLWVGRRDNLDQHERLRWLRRTPGSSILSTVVESLHHMGAHADSLKRIWNLIGLSQHPCSNDGLHLATPHPLADRIPTSGPIVVPSSPAWQMLLKSWLKPRCYAFWSPLQACFFWGFHGIGMLCKA